MAHFIHNSLATLTVLMPEKFEFLTGNLESSGEHLPLTTIVIGCVVFVIGIAFASGFRTAERTHTEAIA